MPHLIVRCQKAIALLVGRWQGLTMSTQFLTDGEGNRIAVVVPVQEYDELMEDVSDLAAVAERRAEPRVSLEEVRQRLIADGLLPR